MLLYKAKIDAYVEHRLPVYVLSCVQFFAAPCTVACSLWYSMFQMFNCVSPYFKTLMGKFIIFTIKYKKDYFQKREYLKMKFHILWSLLLIPFLITVHYSHQLFVHWLFMIQEKWISATRDPSRWFPLKSHVSISKKRRVYERPLKIEFSRVGKLKDTLLL